MRLASRLGGVAVGAALLTPPAWSEDVQISADTKLLGVEQLEELSSRTAPIACRSRLRSM